MNIKRTENRLEIECDSEMEAIRTYSAVLAAGIASADNFGVLPQGMLSSLDDVASMLTRSKKRALSHNEDDLSHKGRAALEAPGSKVSRPR